jgi:hypothetical protein
MRAGLVSLGIGAGCGTFVVLATFLGVKFARWLGKELDI